MARRASIEIISNTLSIPALDALPIVTLINREYPLEHILTFIH
jgi:hypothetical protein